MILLKIFVVFFVIIMTVDIVLGERQSVINNIIQIRTIPR